MGVLHWTRLDCHHSDSVLRTPTVVITTTLEKSVVKHGPTRDHEGYVTGSVSTHGTLHKWGQLRGTSS